MKDPGLLSRHGIKVNAAMAAETAIAAGGNADFFGTVTGERKLAKLVSDALDNDLRVEVIGSGSRTVVSDFGYRGLLIRPQITTLDVDRHEVTIGCAVATSTVTSRLAEESMEICPAFAQLEGTLGGSAWEGWPEAVREKLRTVRLLDGSRLVTIPGEDFDPQRLREGDVLVNAVFSASEQPKQDIHRSILGAASVRLRRQPAAAKRLRLFIEPAKSSVLELAAGLGLAGETVGEAQVSTKNPNFIINRGEARASEIKELSQRVKYRIKLRRETELMDAVAWIGEW
jgi:UDP-N-acetylmuramate dehydrogenase